MHCLFLFQKIEIIDDEESDMISNSEVDQMSSLLDYKVSILNLVEEGHYSLLRGSSNKFFLRGTKHAVWEG